MCTTQQYDTEAGWLWNTKGEVWTTHGQHRDRLANFTPFVGPVVDDISMVGITVPCDIAERERLEGQPYFATVRSKTAVAKAEYQSKRIAKALPRGGYASSRRRALMMQQLVCPKLSWGGQWVQPDDEEVHRQNRCVEKAVNGNIYFRSPALGMIAAGVDTSPEFHRDFAAVCLELTRARRLLAGRPFRYRGSRIDQIAEKWKWTKLGPFVYQSLKVSLTSSMMAKPPSHWPRKRRG